MYRLIALDMDGTLLTSDKSVHPDTIRDIEWAGAQGLYVVYCSGRAVPEILPFVPVLKTMRYAVCMSGAYVYDFEEKHCIFREGIAREYVRRIAAMAAEEDGMAHFLTDSESIVRTDQVTHMADFQMGVYQSMFLEIAKTVDDMLAEAERHESIPKVNVYFRSESSRQRGYEAVKDLPLAIAFAGDTGLEMTAYGVTKAAGLQKLADHLGVSMEETLGIGDSDNDRAVLKAVGFSVAMGNAESDIKKLCHAVTKDNDHNGVGEAIRKYALRSVSGLPAREEAEELLAEAEKCNPGPWGDHSRVAARCAERIAWECEDLDPDRAYILGLLHDIGRKFGVRHLGHVSAGYSYMMSLGYEEAAKICLTHSFNKLTTDVYVGKFDTTEEELKMIRDALETVVLDEYDRLIQLCDAIAGAQGVMDIEERMNDVKQRYGFYPQEKWNNNLELKRHFEEKMGKDIYVVVL